MAREVPIRKLQGLNALGAAELVADNEFSLLQNVYQPTRGVHSRRFGSVGEQTTNFSLCSRISGVWRHYAPSGDRITLYHCVPDATLLPDNTVDLTLADTADGLGNIFGVGNAATIVRICYSWIGRGLEQTYNSRNRAGYPAPGAFPVHAWLNPGHQSITPSGGTNSIKVTVPAFPSGITGANIFASRGTATDMVYMGTVTTSGGFLFIREFIGVAASGLDNFTGKGVAANYTQTANGKLKPAAYRVCLSWVNDTAFSEGTTVYGSSNPSLCNFQAWVTVSGESNAIAVTGPTANSTAGAQAAYVYVGTQIESTAPLVCVGIVRVGTTFNIESIPSHNAQTIPNGQSPEASNARFWQGVNSDQIGGLNTDTTKRLQVRFAFLLAKTAGGQLREIFPSRSIVINISAYNYYQITSDNSYPGSVTVLNNFFPNPRSQNDLYKQVSDANWVQPFAWGRTPNDPQFCFQLGLSFWANGVDIPWVTDGYSLCQLIPAGATHQTLLPPPPRFLTVFQSSLVAFGARNDGMLYMSNANAPQNWAVGGDNTALRFVPIGDAQGSGGTALGIFTPQTEATSNPTSMLIGFKKTGTWMTSTVPDPTANAIAAALNPQFFANAVYQNIPMQQVSGKTGCVAYRSVTQTPQGTIFLGQDANHYLISAVREPQRIGNKVQNLLSHLVGNDSAMRSCTAVYHDNHYKLSYPSATAAVANPIVNDLELWLDMRTELGPMLWFGPHAGRNIGPQVVLGGDNDDGSRVYGDGAVVRTVTADSNTTYADLAANGSAQGITIKIKSKIFRHATEAHVKRFFGAWLDMYLDFSFTNNVLFEGWADSYYQQVNRQISNGGATWDVGLFDQSFFADALWSPFDFLFGGTNLLGVTHQWQISSSDQAPLVLAAITPLIKPEKRRVIS